jgi:low temperature requirement protein LtrA
MTGRDPGEVHRVATSLEQLFDLTFATCFSLAASQLALALTAGRYTAALFGFGFASFAICWAWINFSWFASAYDTDDWIFRLVTMRQMVGVLVLAIGLPRMFASIAQVGWVWQIAVHFSTAAALILGGLLALIELMGPVLAERQDGGTPWNAHHIAERHSSLPSWRWARESWVRSPHSRP